MVSLRPLSCLRLLLSGFFSTRVEGSVRLRLLGLASLWLAALGLTWVGGNPWLTLGGAAGGTLGHWVSWRHRHHRSRTWPLLMALFVVALSFIMRSQILEAINGDWLPLGHFLLLVQAISAFDLRTRGGLYTGLAMSGIALFFASQQAFDSSFVSFLVGFVVLLLAFLALSFLEDGARDAQVHRVRSRSAVLGYWTGAVSASFALSVGILWLMPRGDSSPVRPSQASVRPITPNDIGSSSSPTPAHRLGPLSVSEPDSGNIGQSHGPEIEDPGDGRIPDQLPGYAFLGNRNAHPRDDAVLFVRSPVASYWRGRTLDTFDGRRWWARGIPNDLVRSADSARIWYSQGGPGWGQQPIYQQTFFVRRDQPDAVFMGYRGLRLIADEGALESYGLKHGDSYRVLSSLPRFIPEQLRHDYAGAASLRFIDLPPGSEPWQKLASRITSGVSSDFDKAQRILSYLGQQGNLDPQRAGDLTLSESLDKFLFEGKPGSAMDFATATVMLARASGLPARLAVGYLSGVRDPLSGAYQVRARDAHAWAEILFAHHGWVPFDSAPRPDLVIPASSGSGPLAGAASRLQSSFGEDIYDAAKTAPSRLGRMFMAALNNPAIPILASLLVLLVLALRWFYARHGRQHQKASRERRLAYSVLPGKGRRELLKVYFQVENLLLKKGASRRMPWQTVGEYTTLTAAPNHDVQSQLAWLVQAVWQAAYSPAELPGGLVQEARARLARLKTAMKAIVK